MIEKKLIKRCIKSDRSAQRILYEKYASKMMGICKRYMKQKEKAEEVLTNGFVKVFQHIKHFKHTGSFEGWIRKIMVNEALMELRKSTNLNFRIEYNEKIIPVSVQNKNRLEENEILKLLQYLPNGCRTVFNLYAIEGYKHREIAQQIGISESTSKSQLALAKKKLQQLIMQYGITEPVKKVRHGR